MPWPVAQTYVEACENALGVAFPHSYRRAMMTLNGGAVLCDGDRWDLHPIWDKSDRKRLKRTANDVARETLAKARWSGWPDHAICIAANGTGDALMLLAQASAPDDAVYRWCHETGKTTKIARDFAQLQRV